MSNSKPCQVSDNRSTQTGDEGFPEEFLQNECREVQLECAGVLSTVHFNTQRCNRISITIRDVEAHSCSHSYHCSQLFDIVNWSFHYAAWSAESVVVCLYSFYCHEPNPNRRDRKSAGAIRPGLIPKGFLFAPRRKGVEGKLRFQ